MQTALLSAYNKEPVIPFAKELLQMGWNLLGSSGTVRVLAENGIPARDVAEIVGPPILGHRVVTLSREVHAALLATDSKEDIAELARIGVPRIDLAYVDMYPLEEEVRKQNENNASALEKTLAILEKSDIGGPTILRSAAKGRRIVLCDPTQFASTLAFIRECSRGRPDDYERYISELASVAEESISQYCMILAVFHHNMTVEL